MLKEPETRVKNVAQGLIKNKIPTMPNGAIPERPDQWKPNVTVAAIIERDGKFLMIEEISHGKLVFNQPAGHLEEGESLLQAVEREVREETAWGFKPEKAIGLYMYPSPSSDITYLRVCFSGSCHDHKPELPLDDGIQQVHWMSIEEIRQNVERLRSSMILTCLDDYLAGNQFPLDYIHSNFQSR
ncbi:MAG: NUDIX hydrolase [Gammaproteobacteria bacterium]